MSNLSVNEEIKYYQKKVDKTVHQLQEILIKHNQPTQLFWSHFDQKMWIVHNINNNARSSNGVDSSDDESTDESEIEAHLNFIRDIRDEVNEKKNSNQLIVLLIVLLLHPVHQICLGLQ
jgi:hypothetical protein